MRVTGLMLILGGLLMGFQASGDEQKIREAEGALTAAVVRADVAAAALWLAAEIRYTHTDASADTKEQYLASLANGSMKYESIEQSELEVRLYGKTAVTRSILAMKVTRNGRTSSFRARALRVWVKTGRQWQLVAHQTTRLAA